MSVLLDPTATVLCLAPGDEAVPATLTDELASRQDVTVRHLGNVTALEDALEEATLPACVVCWDLPPGDLDEADRVVRSAAPDTPVLDYGPGSDPARGRWRAGTPAALAELLERALAAARRRAVAREESEMLRAILEQLGKAIYVKDDRGRMLHMADVSGGPDPAAARGKTDLEIYEGEAFARLAYEDDMRVVEDGEVLVREERVPEADMWMETVKVPWTDESGEIRGLIGHTVDVTDRKRTEHRLEELTHRFDTFTNQLRHELKTELQVALGSLPRDPDDEGLQRVEQALEGIDRIVEDYDRLASRSVSVGNDLRPTDLAGTAAEAWAAVEADCEFECAVPDGTLVNTPPAMVRVVVENLLRDVASVARRNATVELGTTDDGFYVQEVGGAIPESRRAVIEQPGYAATQDGSGRELSVVKDEIDRHHWSLAVEDHHGGDRLVVENCLITDVDEGTVERGPLADDRVALERADVVGDVRCPVSAEYDEETDRWHLSGGGRDVFRQDNDFLFVHARVDPAASVRARVVDVEAVTDYSKGGVMIRQDLATDAAYGFVGRTPDAGTELLWRTERGADGRSRQLPGGSAVEFEWVRVDHVGDVVRMLVSMDGRHWQAVDRQSIPAGAPVHAGLVACSTRQGEPCEVVFEDVAVTSVGTDRGTDERGE